MRIDLHESELLICRFIAVMRQSCAMNKVVDQQMGKQDNWGINIDGLVSEYCVAKYLNLHLDVNVKNRKGSSDLLSHKNKTIDVKSTRYKNGKLLATLKKIGNPSDHYILVIVDDFGGDIIGWISKENLFIPDNIINVGHGSTYGVEQSKLTLFK